MKIPHFKKIIASLMTVILSVSVLGVATSYANSEGVPLYNPPGEMVSPTFSGVNFGAPGESEPAANLKTYDISALTGEPGSAVFGFGAWLFDHLAAVKIGAGNVSSLTLVTGMMGVTMAAVFAGPIFMTAPFVSSSWLYVGPDSFLITDLLSSTAPGIQKPITFNTPIQGMRHEFLDMDGGAGGVDHNLNVVGNITADSFGTVYTKSYSSGSHSGVFNTVGTYTCDGNDIVLSCVPLIGLNSVAKSRVTSVDMYDGFCDTEAFGPGDYTYQIEMRCWDTDGDYWDPDATPNISIELPAGAEIPVPEELPEFVPEESADAPEASTVSPLGGYIPAIQIDVTALNSMLQNRNYDDLRADVHEVDESMVDPSKTGEHLWDPDPRFE